MYVLQLTLAPSLYLKNSKRNKVVNLKNFENFANFLKCRNILGQSSNTITKIGQEWIEHKIPKDVDTENAELESVLSRI